MARSHGIRSGEASAIWQWQADRRTKATCSNPVNKPPVKQRVFAHPKRKEPAKVIARNTTQAQVEAIKRAETKRQVAAFGRPAASLSIVAPILPIVGETRADAHEQVAHERRDVVGPDQHDAGGQAQNMLDTDDAALLVDDADIVQARVRQAVHDLAQGDALAPYLGRRWRLEGVQHRDAQHNEGTIDKELREADR